MKSKIHEYQNKYVAMSKRIKTATYSVIVVLVFAVALSSFSLKENNNKDVIALITKKVQDYKLWSVDAKPYKLSKIDHIYSKDEELLAYDLMSPETTVIKGWTDYEKVWSKAMQQFDSWEVKTIDGLEVKATDNLATSTFTFSGEGTLVSGEPIKGEWHVTLIWKEKPDGWKIVHEHISGPVRR